MLSGCASQEKTEQHQEDCSEEQPADTCEDESDDEDVCKRQEIEFHEKTSPAASREVPLAPASSERAAEDAVQREETAAPISQSASPEASAMTVEKQEIVQEMVKKGEAPSELLQALMAESSSEGSELEETEE